MSDDDTTATPETPGPATSARSREQLAASLKRPSGSQLVVGVLLAVLGFATVTQVRSNQVDDTFAGQSEQDLIDVLTGLSGANQRAQSEIARLEAARDQLESASSRRQAALREAQAQADDLAVLAGTVPVTGPGIVVRMEDGRDGTVSIDSFLDLIQELRSSGAEAMSVNGRVRLVAQSAVERSGDQLVIDGVELASPYVLEAIGDPDTLAGALVFRGGPLEQLEDDGAVVTSEKRPTLEIAAVRAADPR